MPEEQKSPNVSHQIMKEKLMGQSHLVRTCVFCSALLIYWC